MLDQTASDDDDFLYKTPALLRFRTATPSIELLTDWYISRAQEIDSCSRQVLDWGGDLLHTPSKTLLPHQSPGP